MKIKEAVVEWGKFFIALIVIFCFVGFIVNLVVSDFNNYPRTMIVTEINQEEDLVTVKDNAGFVWQFYGTEDWQIGDICSCIMNDNGTEDITDDSIVMTRYNGNVEGR